MKTFSSLVFGFSCLSLFAVSAHAQTNTPGYLADFNYQVSNLSFMDDAQRLINSETQNTREESICANRAEVWSYIMKKSENVNVGKVFIHFTPEGQANEDDQWAYHVAPYVIVNGEEMVLDSAFSEFGGRPVKLSDWTEYFGKSQHCVILDPTHNPKHLRLEQNNLPNDQVTPLTYTDGGARQYPTTEGICYIRKVPMYYVYPLQVFGADLALSGNADFNSFLKTEFNDQEVLDACKEALTRGSRFSRSCAKYLGL